MIFTILHNCAEHLVEEGISHGEVVIGWMPSHWMVRWGVGIGELDSFVISQLLSQHSNGRERSVKISKKFFVFTWVSRGSATGKQTGISNFLTSAWESHHS